MERVIYWDLCPYCDGEVELESLDFQPCPKCGAHFQPDATLEMEDTL